MKTVFIDGQYGTVGLTIMRKLKSRQDIQLLEIPEERRKDSAIRKEYINGADVVIFCLPDDAERESISIVENPDTKVISTSTVFRIANGWTYGLAELCSSQRESIKASKRITNPGCYPTGFILALKPLVSARIVPFDYPICSYAITGYSGGGKQMIEEFESVEPDRRAEISCRPKNLLLAHKHLPEMQKYTDLAFTPNFVPIVGNFYKGMLVFTPLVGRFFPKRIALNDIREILSAYYQNEKFIKVVSLEETGKIGDGFLSPLGANDTNLVEIFIFGNEERRMVVARLDNLEKGAAGNAIQNMNLMLGCEESLGL